jgi:(S)-sulfolactate dehydrogenase
MAEVVISEFMDQAAVDELAADHEVLYDPTLVERPEALKAAIADATGLIVRNRTRVDGALLVAAPRLKVVGRLGVGLDNIDLEACAARGIGVFPARGANSAAVAEYVVAAAMILLRGVYRQDEALIAGAWPRQRSIGRELGGKVLGLVGLGAIARETARKARALDMGVRAFDPYLVKGDPAWEGVTRDETLGALLGASDVISLHLPLTAETRLMIDADALARVKPDAVLINVARGGIVDEAALVAALEAGRLAGAAIDVFESEPLTAEAARRFAGLPNLLLTPHVAGLTVEANRRVSALTAQKVRAVLGGEI